MIHKCEYCNTINYFNKTGYCENCDRKLPQNKKCKKDSLIYHIIDETTLVTKVDFDTTVKCLIEQNGGCRETLADGTDMQFFCETDGDFCVRPVSDGYLGYINGRVYFENGETKIVIYSRKYRKPKSFVFGVSIIPFLIPIALFIALVIRKINFTVTTLDVLTAVFIILSLAFTLTKTHKQNQNIISDLQIMKGEVIKRVRAIERWND